MKISVVDLFSGCGGLSLGMQNAGFEILLAVDNWEPAIKIYKQNFIHPIKSIDLSNVESASKEIRTLKPDMIIGGPPCQDYSSAGKRNEELGRADLTISFAEIIRKVKPSFFIMENVDRIVKSNRYKEALKMFKSSGYGLTTITLDASYCGVPQKRKRHFVIGSLNHEDGFLESALINNQTKKSMSVRDYLGNSLGIDHYYRHPRNYNRRAIFSLDEPSPTIRGVNRPLPDGYHGHKNDTHADLRSIRPLTTKERSLIQTFPETFILEGPKTHIEQAVGNAVPVKLAEFVGKCLLDFLQENKN